jgi:tripartite-type tricarboxylate transporter receptor subunit TctC
MARFIQAVVAKHGLAKQPIVVVNLPGDAGAEGFLDVKEDSGNAHKLIITLSNLFTTPLATGVPFNWRDLTPLQMLALDQFVLWVHEASPHQSARGWFDALRSGAPGSMRMGGTGARQEDRLVTLMFEKAAGRRIAYLPFKGGGEVVVQLVARRVDATVNNPIEAEPHWRAGKLRPLCVMARQPMPYRQKVTASLSWADVPPCTSAGLPVHYQMLRGLFMPPGVSAEQVRYYLELFARVRALPDWKDFMAKGAFDPTAMTGQTYVDWLGRAEQTHRALMKEAGLLAR